MRLRHLRIAEAVAHFIAAAQDAGMGANDVLSKLRESVTGIDVHPVAVHLARSAWVLAAQPAIQAAVEQGLAASVTVPIYLGDALQLRFRPGDMFARHNVTLQVQDDENTELVFPVSLVERAETFDALMGDVAEAIETGDDPALALDDNHITDPGERQTLEKTIAAMQRLHSDGRNHIWAYYTRNLVRPVALSQAKVDVIVGNPPWLIYRNTANTLRTELERQSKDVYGIWVGGRVRNHQDIPGLFFARSVDLYLGRRRHRNGDASQRPADGPICQVAHRRMAGGQAAVEETARRAASLSVDFSYKTPWDLERLEPNTFFPVPASVVFAKEPAKTASQRHWQARQSAGWAELAPTLTDRRTHCHNRHIYQQYISLRIATLEKERTSTHVAFFFVKETDEPCHRPGWPDNHRESLDAAHRTRSLGEALTLPPSPARPLRPSTSSMSTWERR